MSASCLDCGIPYEQFALDVNLPRGQWLLIHPEDHGLLCARCLVKRCATLIPGVVCIHAVVEIAPVSLRVATQQAVAAATETSSSDSSSLAGVAARPALARPPEDVHYWNGASAACGVVCPRNYSTNAASVTCQKCAAALARPAWQPMETAPKDGRCLLLYGCEYRRRIWGRGYWFQGVPGDGEGWIASAFYTEPSDDMRGTFTPTHWQALPPPPEEQKI